MDEVLPTGEGLVAEGERTDMRHDDRDWSQSLHELWCLAGSAQDVTALASRIYDILLSLPGVVAVTGSRWNATRLTYLRWGTRHDPGPHQCFGDGGGEGHGTGHAPASKRAPGDTAQVRSMVLPDPGDPAWPEASPLAAAGALATLVCDFRLGPRDWAGLTLGLGPDCADDRVLGTRLRQAAEIVMSCQRRLLARHEIERRQVADAFLAEASLQMDATLDAEETLRRVARLAVPAMADGCVLHLLRNSDLRPVAIAHVAAAEQLRLRQYAAEPWFEELLERAVTGDRDLVLGAGELACGTFGPAGGAAALNVRSLSVSPLRARGRVLGTLTFLYQREQPDAAAPWFLADLARRAALAIDTSLLYEQRRQDVVSLQRHLLPPDLPAVPGLDLGAAYGVADASLEVGGDFYDAVPGEQGALSLFVGDVCGRGAEAAALTGLARHTLRILLEDGHPPERALARLNHVLLRQQASRFLTAAVAHCEPAGDGSGAVRVRLASAGHPVPLLRRADGTVEEVAVRGMMLGVMGQTDHPPAGFLMMPGEMLVLYTDGLTESRSDDGVFFEDLLPAWIADHADAGEGGAARLAAGLVDAVGSLRNTGTDDIAVLVVAVRGEQ
ncbi:PP2C family protein-serine/threonine phosphatase [Streptomyces lavendulae]|uniref:PP2C family protein-serine/threonine phosphatase n=1 Tax=Streptomyces lavendulae TaxID=1914 RepID=UPI00382D38C5